MDKKEYLWGVFVGIMFFVYNFYKGATISLKLVVLSILCGVLSVFFYFLFKKIFIYLRKK